MIASGTDYLMIKVYLKLTKALSDEPESFTVEGLSNY